MNDTPMDEAKLAEFYDAHRGDNTIWEPRPIGAVPRPRGAPSIVVSIRLSRAEAKTLREAAKREGITLSEFLRRGALDRASTTSSPVSVRLTPTEWTQRELVLFEWRGDERTRRIA